MIGKKRQETVCGTACDDLHVTTFSQAPESSQHVLTQPVLEKALLDCEAVQVKPGQSIKLRLVTGAENLLFSEFRGTGQVSSEPFHQEPVSEHGRESGRETHGEMEGDAFIAKSGASPQKGKVTFG